jgi:hypothetical protein
MPTKRQRTPDSAAMSATEILHSHTIEELPPQTVQQLHQLDVIESSLETQHQNAERSAEPFQPGTMAIPISSELSVLASRAAAPASPSGNRARFMAGMQPTKVTCDLTTTPIAPGLRFSFEAIVIVAYPASASPPERRYVELMDQFGTTGITVWNQHVHALGPTSVGCVVKFTRLALTMHNGKKNLTMSKDSTMHVEQTTYNGMLVRWWRDLLEEPALNCLQFQDTPALTVVNVAGILGAIATEEKMVKGQPKQLLVLHLTDRYGKIEVRSWNHSDTEFIRFQEKPILLKRVRVCLYAGSRTGELLTGPHGSMITTDFDHLDLDKYWSE